MTASGSTTSRSGTDLGSPTTGRQAHLFSLPIDRSFYGELTGSAITDAIGPDAEVVSAIVTFHDGTGPVTQDAPYALTVNDVLQPGGGTE